VPRIHLVNQPNYWKLIRFCRPFCFNTTGVSVWRYRLCCDSDGSCLIFRNNVFMLSSHWWRHRHRPFPCGASTLVEFLIFFLFSGGYGPLPITSYLLKAILITFFLRKEGNVATTITVSIISPIISSNDRIHAATATSTTFYFFFFKSMSNIITLEWLRYSWLVGFIYKKLY